MALPARETAIDYTNGGDYIGPEDTTGAVYKLDLDVQKVWDAFVDEDAMTSNSDQKYPSQQSVKAYSDLMLKCDGTKGRVLRSILLTIDDATDANEIKCTVASVTNGDTIAETNNIGKGETVGNFTLDADGKQLKIEAAGLYGNCIYAWLSGWRNLSGTAISIFAYPVANDITLLFYNAATGAAYDLTLGVDTGIIYVYVTYVCSA